MSTKNYYEELTGIPFHTSALLLGNVAQVELAVRDHARNVKRTISKSIFLDTGISSPPVEVIGVVSTVYSPSKKLKAVLRETGEDKDKKRFVEVWKDDTLLACKDVTDKHGIFFGDDFFSSLRFSPSEKSLIYTAEKKKDTSKNSASKFKYQQPFGEGLVGKSNPVLFLYEWESDTLFTLQHNAPVWFGQAVFDPHREDRLFVTGYETAADERLLGILYCFNRLTGIWEITLDRTTKQQSESDSDSKEGDGDGNIIDCQVRKLTDSHLSCRSPRIVNANGKTTLLWLAQVTGGAHWGTASLHACDITHSDSVDPSQTRTLVEKVWEPAKGGFPGLYLNQLPQHPHVHCGGGDYIVTPTSWGSRWTIVLISLRDGSVKELTPVADTDSVPSSWTAVTAAEGNRLLCIRSSTNRPSELVLGEFDEAGAVSWKVLHKPFVSEHLQEKLDSLTVKVVPIPGRFPAETILIQHKSAVEEKKILPCITMPHGGPHAAESITFNPVTVAYALEGYTLSLPNYTGSTGYGEKSIQALIGQCGTLDVGDCIESVRHLVKTGVASEGRGRLMLSGGSHGGFLLGHLIGQYPDVFTAAVFRNPVVSADISTSDIEDWYYAEFGIDYPLSSLPLGYTGPSSSSSPGAKAKAAVPPRVITPEIHKKLYDASPIAHVHKVRDDTAVLMLLGDSDKRVAPTQGVGYYHALRAIRYGRGRKEEDAAATATEADVDDELEMLIFGGEGHPIDGLEASRVVWTRTAEWFKKRAVW
ncbi:hypothetical protein GYMLUDRAFT_38158 [Collybiopsis luxurians FD-317 M1]|nr:hypothetical protein GYMLUDRAFT_38158 [Collybiopsis luxurians FD-317 M1]